MPLPAFSRPSRRDVLKYSGIFSAAAVSGTSWMPVAAAQSAPAVKELINHGSTFENLYTKIGVRPILNARGTYTIISGSMSLPEVKQAMFEASQYFVQLDELMAAVGAEIAQHMGAPSAIVTCGCEAAIALATVACICGTDPERSQAFPYYKVRNQVIIPKYARNPYDFGVRMSGPEVVEVETEDELRAKISGQTAMIYVLSGPRAFQEPLSIRTICRIAHEENVPVFVDAAAEEPLVPNIHLEAGATFVGYSGGKCMRGPQTAGVLLGPKDLCAAAFWNAAPHHNWGRALKVGKEEAMGMLAAVRMWYKRDHEAEQLQWLAWNQEIADSLKGIPSLRTEMTLPTADLSNRAPTLSITWNATQVGITGLELVETLDKGTPRIFVLGGEGHRPNDMQSSIGIMPYMMQPGDQKIVAEALNQHLRHPAHFVDPTPFNGPDTSLAGVWDVVVEYTRGTGHQRLFLQENGQAITGELHGELFSAPVLGTATGTHVQLKSTLHPYGYEVPFTFTGDVNGSTFSGGLHLGEYGDARFVATKAQA